MRLKTQRRRWGRGPFVEVLQHAGLQMLILFTVVLLGAVARKLHLMNDDFDALLSKLVMTVTLPGMILNSVLGNSNLPDSQTIVMVMVYSTVLYIFVCLFAWVFVKVAYHGVPKPAQGAHAYLISFGNTGFIGFAVVGAIMGSDSVLYAAIYNIPYNVFLFSVGMLFIASTGDDGVAAKKPVKEQLKAIGKQLLSPCLISCFAAVALALFGITDDGYVGQTCNLLGQMTVPAAMLVIGSTLAKQPIKQMLNDGWSYLTSIMRLAVVPLLIFFIGGLFIHDPYILAVIVIESAMPAASSGIMMCLAYGGDTMTMSRGTFITTILSLVSLPLLAMLVV